MPRFHSISVPSQAATHQSAAGFFRVIELPADAIVMGGEPDPDYPDLAAFLAASGLSAYVRPATRRPARPAAPYAISKLALVRALRAAGMEPAFQTLLAASPEFSADWLAASVLMSDDPMLAAAAAAFADQAGISIDHVTAMLAACRA